MEAGSKPNGGKDAKQDPVDGPPEPILARLHELLTEEEHRARIRVYRLYAGTPSQMIADSFEGEGDHRTGEGQGAYDMGDQRGQKYVEQGPEPNEKCSD